MRFIVETLMDRIILGTIVFLTMTDAVLVLGVAVVILGGVLPATLLTQKTHEWVLHIVVT